MTEELTKEVAEKLMALKEEARGMNLKNDAQFILKYKGKEGLEAVEKELAAVGVPIKYSEIKSFAFYPVGLRALSLLAIKKAFDWQDDKIKEVCSFATYITLIAKLTRALFYSPESLGKISEQAPTIWREYFSGGELTIPEYDLEKKYCVIRIKDFSGHPVFCHCLEGYFEKLTKTVTGAKEAHCEERKCAYKGDEYHELFVTWN